MKILMLCGTKQSGKSSGARFIAAYKLSKAGEIGNFNMDYEGELWIPTKIEEDGEIKEQDGLLDLRRRDYEFQLYASRHFWPHVKIYSLADVLKESVAEIFGLNIDELYGTEEEKNRECPIKWSDMASILHPKIIANIREEGKYDKQMTNREFLQYFGTNICRAIMGDCWVQACLRRIKEDQPELAIIDDGRFPNEVETIKENGGKVIYLRRSPDKEDLHDSEKAIQKLPLQEFDYTVDNRKMTLAEKNKKLFDALVRFGWVEGFLR